MASLYEFLQDRGVPDDQVAKMEEDEIDEEVLSEMKTDSDDLKRYLPKYGHRVMAVAFAARKLKETIEKKKTELVKIVKDDMCTSEHNRRSAPQKGNANAKKITRRVELGLLLSEKGGLKQIRSQRGGGTRQLILAADYKLKDLQDDAKNMFFPNGESKIGHVNNFEFHIADFKHESIQDQSVSEFYDSTKVKLLKVYLVCKEIAVTENSSAESDTEEIPPIQLKKKRKNPKDCEAKHTSEALKVPSTSKISEKTISSTVLNPTHMLNVSEPSLLPSVPEPSTSSTFLVPSTVPETSMIPSLQPFLENVTSPVPYILQSLVSHGNDTNSTGTTVPPDATLETSLDPEIMFRFESEDVLPENDVQILDNTVAYSVEQIKVHRGNVFKEMLQFFLDKQIDILSTKIELKMILPNGEEETGEDNGGVLRDALVEFWNTFYVSHTDGEDIKVPIVSNFMSASRWMACAEILYLGYKQEGYFPVKLAPPFLKKVVYGKEYHPSEDYLLPYFMQFLPDVDNETITQALVDISLVDDEELIDILSTYKVTFKPTSQNVKQLVFEAAHRILIQQVSYIADCWHDTFTNYLTSILKENFEDILKSLSPTAKTILSVFDFGEVESLSLAKRNTMDYLKRFVKGLKGKDISDFLRYITGSDLLVVNQIKIDFIVPQSEFTRAPIAHTCACLLELPYSYFSFQEFREEFQNILSAKVWVMDAV